MKLKEAKPILVVKIDNNYPYTQLGIIERNLRITFNHEYHVLVLPVLVEGEKNVELEVLNIKDLDGIELQQLKDEIKKDIDAINRTREGDKGVLGDDKGEISDSDL